MKHNEFLSICIPTYNGEEKISENLAHLLPIVSRFNIAVFISDNASKDNTQEVINQFQSKYPFINYYRNYKNVGPDRNFEKVLKSADTKYCWLLGNDDLILEESLEKVLDMARSDNEYALICLNNETCSGEMRVAGINDRLYYDCNELMADLGSHLTQMSILIFNRGLLNSINLDEYYSTSFLQTLAAYNIAARSCLPVAWLNEKGFIAAKSSSCNFSDKIFYIFTVLLYDSVKYFDEKYTLKSKKKYVRQHFSYLGDPYRFLLNARLRGEISLRKFFKYYKAISWALRHRFRLFAFISCFIPKKFLLAIKYSKRGSI